MHLCGAKMTTPQRQLLVPWFRCVLRGRTSDLHGDPWRCMEDSDRFLLRKLDFAVFDLDQRRSTFNLKFCFVCLASLYLMRGLEQQHRSNDDTTLG